LQKLPEEEARAFSQGRQVGKPVLQPRAMWGNLGNESHHYDCRSDVYVWESGHQSGSGRHGIGRIDRWDRGDRKALHVGEKLQKGRYRALVVGRETEGRYTAADWPCHSVTTLASRPCSYWHGRKLAGRWCCRRHRTNVRDMSRGLERPAQFALWPLFL